MPDTSLRFGSDAEPGIRRHGHQRVRYVDERTGKRPARRHLERIAALAVPPAWTDVWIAADPNSHVQATGRDARGRKQYRYHARFTADRADTKFADLVAFGHALGSLRARVRRDLAGDDLDHAQVVAAVVRLLDLTGLRVGNAQYATANRSFGLTTLRDRHAVVRGSAIHLTFRGKSAHEFEVDVDHPRLARIVRRCQHLPGQTLFAYRTAAGEVRTLDSSDVNEYLAEYAAPGVTSKTFRTWNATVGAAQGLAHHAALDPEPRATHVNEVIDDVANTLGNTRAVCRNSYVHPRIVEHYLDGTLLASWNRRVGAAPRGTTVDERKVLRLLR